MSRVARKSQLDVGPRVAAAMDRVLRSATFEVIPLSGVYAESAHLPRDTVVPITASPTKGMGPTVELAGWLRAQGLDPVPHLSARLISDPGMLEAIVARLDQVGVRRVFVVGGDGEPTGEFSDGLSLLQAMDQIGHPFDEVGIPVYPEGHHFISPEVMRQALRDKQPYADYMTTQMCFDPAAIVRWLADVRAGGITLPAHVGLPGVASLRKLVAISTRIGVGSSLRYLTKQHGLAGKLARPGGFTPDELLVGLGDSLVDPEANVETLRFFTFNQVESTESWRRQVLWDLHRVLR